VGGMIYDICKNILAIVGTIGLVAVIGFLTMFICLGIYYGIKEEIFKDL
jgi:hypothetical protein